MRGAELTVSLPAGHLGGCVAGDGVPVLLLHGGPGLPYAYLDAVTDELVDRYEVASYQQRGLAPSMTEGPYDVDTQLADVAAVLDSLGWAKAYVVGHSWGGHLALHAAVALAERLLGVLCVDPLGGVDDGGAAGFGAELQRRTPAAEWARAEELDAKAMAGEGTDDEAIESLRLILPAYFADWTAPAPIEAPEALSVPAYSGGFESLVERLPGLEAALSTIAVPLAVLAGGASPMPVDVAAEATAARIPGAWVEVVPDAGHFPWVEKPGCVRSALDRLVAG